MLEAILKEQHREEQKKHSLIKGKIKYYVFATMLVADLIAHYSCQEIKIVDPMRIYYHIPNDRKISRDDLKNKDRENISDIFSKYFEAHKRK